VSQWLKQDAIKALGPHQTALQSNGTTKTVFAVRNTLERHGHFIGLFPDAKNAFNTLSRKSAISQMGESIPGYIKYLHQTYGQDADIIIAQAGEGVPVLDRATSKISRIRWIKSRQGTQQGDPIGMTMYCCGQKKVLRLTIEFTSHLARNWRRQHGPNTLKGKEAQDWLLIAYADDLAICAPPFIAALIYCRYAYLNMLYNSSVFKPSKNKAFSMDLSPEELRAQLTDAFAASRILPQESNGEFTLSEESANRDIHDYATYTLTETDNTVKAYSLLVPPEKDLKFSSQAEGIDGVELLGIPIEKENDNRFTQTLMLQQLNKTIKTWEKAQEHIKSNHARFQILNFCLRTRFHHFCRGIRPSQFKGPVRPTIEYLKKRNPKTYSRLHSPDPQQTIIDYIDSWFWKQALQVTGRYKADMLQREDKIRFTFPRRKGGMGFSLLSDVLPGAFAAAFLECLYPRGLNKYGEPRPGDISLRAICPVLKRSLPHLSMETRRASLPPAMHITEKLYHLCCPLRMNGGSDPHHLTRDVKEFMQATQEIAEFPTITGQLFLNPIIIRQSQILSRTERNLKPIFHNRKLIHGFAHVENGINVPDLMTDLPQQPDKLTIVKKILEKTKDQHYGAKTNRTRTVPFHTPEPIESGAALALLLYAGQPGEPVDWRNIGYGSNIPVYRNRLQRIFNRAIQEAKVDLLCNVSDDDHPSAGFRTPKSRKLWQKGLINPVTKKIPSLLRHNLLMEEEKTMLAEKVTKFGGGTAGASVTQIATWSSILLRNTLLENSAFNIQLTLRTTGSLAILDKAGPKHAIATCQIQSRNPANKGKVCNNVLRDFTHFASCKLSGHHCHPHKVLEDVLLECIRDAYTHHRSKATAQVVLTEDKRPTAYNNLHTSIPSTIMGNTEAIFTGDIIEDDDTFGKFTQPDLLLITNGILPREDFPITSKSKPRPLHMNSLANRDRQFQAFIAHCATNGLKYEFFDVHFSHKDESSLETNERIKRNGYQKAFWNFAEKAQDPTHRHHHTFQMMKRLNHTRGGGTKSDTFWSQHLWGPKQGRAQSTSQTGRNPISGNPSLPKLPECPTKMDRLVDQNNTEKRQ